MAPEEPSSDDPLCTSTKVTSYGNNEERDSNKPQKTVIYGVHSTPPIGIIIVYAFQLLLTNIGGTLSMVYLIHANLCSEGNDLLFADLLATGIFMVGLNTFLQCTYGSRLPIYQGSARSFLPALTAVMVSKQHICDMGSSNNSNWSKNSTTTSNVVFTNDSMISTDEKPEAYKVIINEVSGSLAVAACVQVLIGFTGITGFLMTFVGPLTIAPLVALIGLGLTTSASEACKHHWGIALLTIGLVYLFSVVLEKVEVPLPSLSLCKTGRKKCCTIVRSRIFKLYPQMMAMGTTWGLCAILTATNYFPNDKTSPNYKARTDTKIHILGQVNWFQIPYPGKYGMPTFALGTCFGFIAAILPSILDTAGDYYAAARACGLPSPPAHAVNRGIFIDGIGRVLNALVGSCHATSSYSTSVGFISLTGVGSRIVWQVTAVLIMVIGIFSKIAGCLSLVPDPIMGGMATVGLMVLVGVALSNLQFVDLNSTRNQVVVGTALMIGLMVPQYMKRYPGIIQTGNPTLDQLLTILLSTGMCIGGLTACILDNVLPGTLEERGILSFNEIKPDEEGEMRNKEGLEVYEFPLLRRCLRKATWCKYLPVSPTFKGNCKLSCRGNRKRET